MRERVDAGVHAGHHGDAGVRDAVEPGELKSSAILAVGREQVVEVRHGGTDYRVAVSCLVTEAPPEPGRLL